MRKKIKFAAMVLSVSLLAAGCGSNNATTSENNSSSEVTSTGDIDYSKYVTLGEYLGVETEAVSAEVTDEELEAEIQNILASKSENVEITDRDTVQEGDIANIDYKGMKDGEAFDGGTAEAYELEIGSGMFIEGFEEQLVGVKVGDTVELDLTFPEDYLSEELAGQAVVFEVTVNSISEKVNPELTEEFVTTNTDYDSVDTFREGTLAKLKETKESNAELEHQSMVWEQVIANCEISGYPDELIEKCKQQIESYYGAYAQQYGMELNDFVETFFGTTTDELAKTTAQGEMVFKLIAQKEGLEVSDEEFETEAATLATEYGYEDKAAFVEANGEEAIKDNILREKMLDLITDAAVIK